MLRFVIVVLFAVCLIQESEKGGQDRPIEKHFRKCQGLLDNGKTKDAIELLNQYEIEKETKRLANRNNAIFFVDTRMVFEFIGIDKIDAKSVKNCKVHHFIPSCYDEHNEGIEEIDEVWVRSVGRFAIRFNQEMFFALVNAEKATCSLSLDEVRGYLDIDPEDWKKLKNKDKYQIHQLATRLLRAENTNKLPTFDDDGAEVGNQTDKN